MTLECIALDLSEVIVDSPTLTLLPTIIKISCSYNPTEKLKISTVQTYYVQLLYKPVSYFLIS